VVNESKSNVAEVPNKITFEKKLNLKVFILFEFLFVRTIYVKVVLYIAVVVIKIQKYVVKFTVYY